MAKARGLRLLEVAVETSNLGAAQQGGGLLELIALAVDAGEGTALGIRVGKDGDGEGAGEPDQVLAALERSEVVRKRVEGVERVLYAEHGLEAGHAGLEVGKVGRNLSERGG